jgi:hypothetical protein
LWIAFLILVTHTYCYKSMSLCNVTGDALKKKQ